MSRSRLLIRLACAGVLLAVVAGPVLADSAPVTDKTNAVSVNPLALIFGGISANFEHKMNEKSSITAGFQYYSSDATFVKSTFLGVEGGYRMYFSPVAPDGFYWEPFVSVGSQSIEIDVFGSTGKGSGISFAPGVLVGRQWVWEGGFLIDLAIGGAFYLGGVTVDLGGSSYEGSYSGFGLAGKFALGYAWK